MCIVKPTQEMFEENQILLSEELKLDFSDLSKYIEGTPNDNVINGITAYCDEMHVGE